MRKAKKVSSLKPFAWSFSALTSFETCPHKYAEEKVYKNFVEGMSAAGQLGIEIHTHLEHRLLKKIPLPDDIAQYEKWCTAIESKVDDGDLLKCEMEMCINREFQPVSWFAKDAWCRVKNDVLLLKEAGSTAYLYDWKTGKVKGDKTQLELAAAVMSCMYPTIERFITKWVWLKHDQVTPKNNQGDLIMVEGIPDIWRSIYPRAKRMENAYNDEVFPMTPNGLCGQYCPVTTCPHNGRHGK